MNQSSVTDTLSRLFDVRPGEIRRVAIMMSLLFFLLAANNVIKVARDSLFLSHFPIDHLPYVYLLAAVFAGVIIAAYSRYTVKLPIYRLILGSNAFIISSVIAFWVLIVFFNFAWAIYAFYVWSAIVGLLSVAQFWTFAGLIFTAREAKRLFGFLSAGGSLGAILGGFGSGWAVNWFTATGELFWLTAALFAGAFGVVWLASNELSETAALTKIPTARETKTSGETTALSAIRASKYLQLIAGTIFVSTAVSTLIDFQFKAAAKTAYVSQSDLAAFFGAFYAWVAIITFVTQLFLTARFLTHFGLFSSLLLLPVTLFAGSLGILIWPGLFSATATRLTDSVFRTSINQSGMEILYLPLSVNLKKQVKAFLDVVLQRLGDGAAGLIVLFYALFVMRSAPISLVYFSLALIAIWAVCIFFLGSGYVQELRAALQARVITWEREEINYADKHTVKAVLESLQTHDEHALLFGLELAEQLDPKVIVPRLPLGLLRHPSPLVRSRSLKLFGASTDPQKLQEIARLLQDESAEVQAEAINVVCAIRKEDAIPVMRPYLESPDPRVQRSAIECLLHHGDPEIRRVALAAFRKMIENPGLDGAAARVEAARLIGTVNDRELRRYLSKLIRDSSTAVVREALAAAGKVKEPTVLRDVLMQLGSPNTKRAAHQALVEYGEIAVETLREMLLDHNISRDARLNIPSILSKIASPTAMNALLDGLNQEDGSLRYRIIVALEEIARRLPKAHIDRRAIESVIEAEASRYYRRFLTLFVLFGDESDGGAMKNGSLLHQALLENMDREKERVLRLLSLIYDREAIQSAAMAFQSGSQTAQAQAIEFLDNLLTGDVKRHVFPLFDDAPDTDRFQQFLALLGLKSFDADTALHELLQQDDVWLQAATLWEIGLRKLKEFREELQRYIHSKDAILKETAELVISRI